MAYISRRTFVVDFIVPEVGEYASVDGEIRQIKDVVFLGLSTEDCPVIFFEGEKYGFGNYTLVDVNGKHISSMSLEIREE